LIPAPAESYADKNVVDVALSKQHKEGIKDDKEEIIIEDDKHKGKITKREHEPLLKSENKNYEGVNTRRDDRHDPRSSTDHLRSSADHRIDISGSHKIDNSRSRRNWKFIRDTVIPETRVLTSFRRYPRGTEF